jgi:hypothetical protein
VSQGWRSRLLPGLRLGRPCRGKRLIPGCRTDCHRGDDGIEGIAPEPEDLFMRTEVQPRSLGPQIGDKTTEDLGFRYLPMAGPVQIPAL